MGLILKEGEFQMPGKTVSIDGLIEETIKQRPPRDAEERKEEDPREN